MTDAYDLPPERMAAIAAWRMAIRSLRRYRTARGFWPTREQLATFDRRRSPEWWRGILDALREAGIVRRWLETPEERDTRRTHQARRRHSMRASRRSYRFALVDEYADAWEQAPHLAPHLAPRLAPHRPDPDTIPLFEDFDA